VIKVIKMMKVIKVIKSDKSYNSKQKTLALNPPKASKARAESLVCASV
jgi:hypothetical protein